MIAVLDDGAIKAEVSLHLAEYSEIKSEQRARIAHRDGLVYSTLAALAAVVAGTIQMHSTAVLLLLPPVAIVLGWKYLANDEKITAAASYVRDHMSARLAELTGASSVFGWERAHRVGVYRRMRRHVQCAVDALTFCVLPLAGLVTFWTSGPCPAGLIVVSGVEAVSLAGLGWLITITCYGTRG